MQNNIQIIPLQKKSDLYRLLFGAKYIGSGKTSYCFLLRNGLVLKIYKHNLEKQRLFNCVSMQEQIFIMNTLKNDSYLTPEIVYKYREEILGYCIDYKKAKTLAKINNQCKVFELINSIEKLVQDTYLVGEKRFILKDIHNRNILYNGDFYIIDLDYGYIGKETIEEINKQNIQTIMNTILSTLFDVKKQELLFIKHSELMALYNKTIFESYENIYSFFKLWEEVLENDNLKVKDLKRNRFIKKEYNTYYKNPLL